MRIARGIICAASAAALLQACGRAVSAGGEEAVSAPIVAVEAVDVDGTRVDALADLATASIETASIETASIRERDPLDATPASGGPLFAPGAVETADAEQIETADIASAAPTDDAPDAPDAPALADAGPDAAAPDDAAIETADVDLSDLSGLFVRSEEQPLSADGPARRSGEYDASSVFIDDRLAELDDFDPFERPDIDSEARISIPELFRRVMETNTDIRLAAATEDVRGFDVDIADAAYSPTVDLDVIGSTEWSGTDRDGERPLRVGEATVTINYRIYDFGARDYDAGRARASAAEASAALRAVAEETFEEVARALLAAMEAQETLAEVDANIVKLQQLVELVSLREEQGAGTVADVEQLESRLDAAQTARSGLVTGLESARNAFARAAGMPLEAIIAEPLLDLPPSVARLDVGDVALHPDVVALEHRIEALRRSARALERGRLPTVDLELLGTISSSHSTTYDNTTIGSVGLTLSHRLWDGGAARSQVSQTLAQIQQAELRRATRIEELVEEAQNLQRTLAAANETEVSLTDQVASLEQVAVLYVDQFAAGQRTLLEILEADAALLDARISLLRHRFERVRTAMTQLRLGGRLTEALLVAEFAP